jgi:hypothetical protein
MEDVWYGEWKSGVLVGAEWPVRGKYSMPVDLSKGKAVEITVEGNRVGYSE